MDDRKYFEIINKVKTQQKPDEKYKIVEDTLYRKKRINDEIRWLKVSRRYEIEGVMYMMHDHPLSAHFSVRKTYDKIRERYYWSGMFKDVETYVKTCWNCQMRGKPNNKNELNSIRIVEPFYQIGIDYVGPLPITENGNRYIITAMDYFTKWPEAKAVAEATAKETAGFIYEDIICRHGCPKRILTDRGSHFNNQMVNELMTRFGIKHKLSTPYHPKTNGLIERFNKTLCEGLAKLTDNGKNWDKEISSVLFAYRTNKHSSNRMTPFYLTYGRKARLQMDKEQDSTINSRIEHIVEKLPEERRKAKEENLKTQDHQKKYHDQKIKKKIKFQIGDKVLYYKAAKEKQWTGKLEDNWKGPYYIHEKLFGGSYKIKELDGRVLKTPVNGELLKQFNSREDFEPIIIV